MNPLTNVKNIQKLNERMLEMGVEDSEAWHKQYKDSAYIFIGGLPYGLTEGDILCVFSQYGEIVNINLVRDKKTGKTKGFCFLCYEDQRSTILAVDNFNGIKLGGRTIRVDHCSNYRRPKGDEKDEHGNYKEIIEEGCAPKTPPPSPPPSPPQSDEKEEVLDLLKKRKKEKKQKKQKKSKEKSEKKRKMSSSSEEEVEKKQKHDLMRMELPRKERVQDKILVNGRDRQQRTGQDDSHDHKSRHYKDNTIHRTKFDQDFGRDRKGNRDVALNSQSQGRDDNYKRRVYGQDRKNDAPERDRHASDDYRDQRDDPHYSSHGERDLDFDKRRRERYDKQRDPRKDDRRSYEKRGRNDYDGCKDRR